MRRLRFVAIVVVGLAVAGLLSRGATQSATPSPPLPSGSWWMSSATGYPDLPTFAAFAPSGGVTAGYIRWWYTDAYGTWRAGADGDVDVTLRAFEGDEHGIPRTRIKIRGTLTFEATRGVWTGAYRIEREPFSGGETTATDGTWELSPIEVEPLP